MCVSGVTSTTLWVFHLIYILRSRRRWRLCTRLPISPTRVLPSDSTGGIFMVFIAFEPLPLIRTICGWRFTVRETFILHNHLLYVPCSQLSFPCSWNFRLCLKFRSWWVASLNIHNLHYVIGWMERYNQRRRCELQPVQSCAVTLSFRFILTGGSLSPLVFFGRNKCAEHTSEDYSW